MTQDTEFCDTHVLDEKKVKAIRKKMPKNILSEKVVQVFKTLGSLTRFKILYALNQGELCVCDIDAVDPAGIFMVAFVLKLVVHYKDKKQRAGDADRQPGNVDECRSLLPDQIAQCDF